MTGKNRTEKDNGNIDRRDSTNSSGTRDSDLTRIMAEVGKEYGYREVTAEFAEYRDFKIRWTRNSHWAEFQISDYLDDAPESVLRGLARTVFAKIKGQDADYPDDVTDWMTAPEFVENHRPRYLERSVGISEGTEGRHIDLAECRDRLVEAGLVDRDDDIEIRWVRQNSHSIGRSSLLMRVVAINNILDREDMYEDAIDYALYSEICKVNQGYGPFRKSIEDIREEISRFKDHSDARYRLAAFGVSV